MQCEQTPDQKTVTAPFFPSRSAESLTWPPATPGSVKSPARAPISWTRGGDGLGSMIEISILAGDRSTYTNGNVLDQTKWGGLAACGRLLIGLLAMRKKLRGAD